MLDFISRLEKILWETTKFLALVVAVSVLVSTLDSVANQVKLGDTNTAVPGRLLGRVEAYEEAGASEYIKDTVGWGYKLVFIDNKPPPSNYRANNRSALSNSVFFLRNFCVWKVWVAQQGLIQNPILSTHVALCTAKSGGVSWTPPFS